MIKLRNIRLFKWIHFTNHTLHCLWRNLFHRSPTQVSAIISFTPEAHQRPDYSRDLKDYSKLLGIKLGWNPHRESAMVAWRAEEGKHKPFRLSPYFHSESTEVEEVTKWGYSVVGKYNGLIPLESEFSMVVIPFEKCRLTLTRVGGSKGLHVKIERLVPIEGQVNTIRIMVADASVEHHLKTKLIGSYFGGQPTPQRNANITVHSIEYN